MNRPVDATGFAVLAGAVEWIDDPHAVGAESSRVLATLLREHGVVRSVRRELLGEELLREGVAGVLDIPGRGALGEQLLARFEEQVARLGGQARGELAVGLLHQASFLYLMR